MYSKLVYNAFVLRHARVATRPLHVGPTLASRSTLPAGRRFIRQHESERDSVGYVVAVLSSPKKNRNRKLHWLKAPSVEGCFRRNLGNGQVVDPEIADTSRSTEPKTVIAGFRHPVIQISETDLRAIRSPKSILFIGSRESAMPTLGGNHGHH